MQVDGEPENKRHGKPDRAPSLTPRRETVSVGSMPKQARRLRHVEPFRRAPIVDAFADLDLPHVTVEELVQS